MQNINLQIAHETKHNFTYSPNDIAQILRLNTRTIYNYCNINIGFRIMRIGRSIRIHRDSFNKWFGINDLKFIFDNKQTYVYLPKEIAEILNISIRTVYNLCETTNDFKVLNIGRSVRIHKESFDMWFGINEATK